MGNLRIRDVINRLDQNMGPHFFPISKDGKDSRQCPLCKDGRLGIKLGKTGGFIGCSNYSEKNCRFARPLSIGPDNGNQGLSSQIIDKVLGEDPVSDLPVILKKGPYGWYIQLGNQPKDKNSPKPKRVSMPENVDLDSINFEIALKYLSLPRNLGTHPKTGKIIEAKIGKFGPYIKTGNASVSIPSSSSVLDISLNEAVELLKNSKTKSSGEEIGKHPKDGQPLTLHSGKYGPYVKHGKINASIPKKLQNNKITLEQAVSLLEEKANK
jgi:DNA topoisomerase-1